MIIAKHGKEFRRTGPSGWSVSSDRFGSFTLFHDFESLAIGNNSLHKTLRLPLAKIGELRQGRKAHTPMDKARGVPQPWCHQNSFIVAKPSGPIRLSCNSGALLLLPPSLVRAGALRSIFIPLVPA